MSDYKINLDGKSKVSYEKDIKPGEFFTFDSNKELRQKIDNSRYFLYQRGMRSPRIETQSKGFFVSKKIIPLIFKEEEVEFIIQ